MLKLTTFLVGSKKGWVLLALTVVAAVAGRGGHVIGFVGSDM
jgi:hypothetical protein